MKLVRGLVVATACASLVSTVACEKAKDALKDALGVDQLKDEQIAALLQETGWNAEDPRLKGFKILGGIKITDKFKGDLGEEVDVPVPQFTGSEQADGKVPSISLLKVLTFTLNDKEYKRFKIVSVGRYDAASSALKVDGDLVNQYLDEEQKLNKDNQASDGGTYLLVQGATSGLAYLKGTTKVNTAAGGSDVVGGALIFTNASPFVAESGKTSGQYFLAMLEGEKGTVTGYKKGLGTTVIGTPESAATDIPYASFLTEFPEIAEKANDAAAKTGSKGVDYLAQAISKVTELGAKYGYKWPLLDANLVWTQPPQSPPKNDPPVVKPPVNPEPASPPGEEPSSGDDTTPNTDPSPEPEVRTASEAGDVKRSDDESDPQVDLGCDGILADGTTSSFLYDGSKYSDDTIKGWRFQGDVRATWKGFVEIFGSPSALATKTQGRYLDVYASACVLTTGDQMYQKTKEDIFQPGPGGAGQTSEMWQKVKVPNDMKSIQVRVAFLSQEYPKFVGTKFNDSFFIKFDESLNYIAAGNLNEIAGEGKEGIDISTCKNQANAPLIPCGDWQPIKGEDPPSASALTAENPPSETSLKFGNLFDIGQSTQAQAKGIQFGAMTEDQVSAAGSGAGRSYYGVVPPRIICRDLDPETEVGKTLTLRFSVSDVGDDLFDSALVVDSVVFAAASCSERTFTGEDDSRASEL